MQTDPIGYDDGMNWYAYVGNDPVNMADPTGSSGEHAYRAAAQLSMKGANVLSAADKAISIPTQGEVATLGSISTTVGIVMIAVQPELSPPLISAGTGLGYVAAAMDENPGEALLTEVVANLTGDKLIGSATKIAKGMQTTVEPVIEKAMDIVDSLVSGEIKNEMKEDK